MDINSYVDIISDEKGCILFDGQKYNEKKEEDGGGTVRKDIVFDWWKYNERDEEDGGGSAGKDNLRWNTMLLLNKYVVRFKTVSKYW